MRYFSTLLISLLSLSALAANITIDGYAAGHSTGEWHYALTSRDGKWYADYYIQHDTLENGKTYLFAELQDSYAVYCKAPNLPNAPVTQHPFTDATFCITVLDSVAQTGTIVATFVSRTDGESYTLTYSGTINEKPMEPPTTDPTEIVTSLALDNQTDDFVTAVSADDALPYMQPILNTKEIEVRVAYNDTIELNIAFQVDIDSFRNNTYVPAGEYTISLARDSGTVYAGQGITADGYTCVGTYAIRMQNGTPVNYWFVTAGTVVVAENGNSRYIRLEGTNSHGRNVLFTIGTEPTQDEPIEDALPGLDSQPATEKLFRNGQLIIRRQNQSFSVLGQKL